MLLTVLLISSDVRVWSRTKWHHFMAHGVILVIVMSDKVKLAGPLLYTSSIIMAQSTARLVNISY